ncbi:MAG TPA: hypothetical protein PKE40_00660 [Arachnia sp.]|nr:hypothetical protein [Arachnia sp.]HMT84837.1 hypothetical protein [Arachnia sp.]
MDGCFGTFALRYEGALQQLAGQNLGSSSVAYFQTVPATVELIDHAGDPLDIRGEAATRSGATSDMLMAASPVSGPIQKPLQGFPEDFEFAFDRVIIDAPPTSSYARDAKRAM